MASMPLSMHAACDSRVPVAVRMSCALWRYKSKAAVIYVGLIDCVLMVLAPVYMPWSCFVPHKRLASLSLLRCVYASKTIAVLKDTQS